LYRELRNSHLALIAVWAFTFGVAELSWSAENAQGSASAYLRPNGMTAKAMWSQTGGESHFDAVDDTLVTGQTPGATDYISASGHPPAEIELELSRIGLTPGTMILNATAWFYTSTSSKIEAAVLNPPVISEGTFAGAGWHSLSASLKGTQAQLDSLKIRFKKPSGAGEVRIQAAFLKLEIDTPPTGLRTFHLGISANARSEAEPELGQLLDDVTETGTRRLREDLEWERVEPVDDEWDWSEYDELFAAAGERGMSILPILNSPPCWAVPAGTESGKCWNSYPVSDAEYAEYAEYTAEAADRYGPGGVFWSEHPGLDPSLAPRYFEVWNEPYLPEFTNNNVNPARYADLYKAAVVAGRVANPATRYLIEAIDQVQVTASGKWVNWAEALLAREPALGNYIDGIAIHPYPENRDPFYLPEGNRDPSFWNTERVYKDWAARGVNRPIWITEIGYSSCDDGANDCVPGSTQAVREEQKAEWLRDLFDVIDREELGYVHAVYVYNYQSSGLEEPTDKSQWFGLLDGKGNVLPAWDAFADAVEAFDGTPEANTTITGKSTSSGNVTFTFKTTDPTAKTECQLDAGAWSTCASPKTYAGVSGPGHTFRARSTNAEATESAPATNSW
jgi:hypothetical protein